MTDDKDKPQAPASSDPEKGDKLQLEDLEKAAKPETDKAEKKPKAADPEKEAKIAAAKAKKAAAKAAADAKPKQPWEEKPVPPAHADAADDADVAALAKAIEGSVEGADTFADDVTVTIARDKVVEVCRFLKEQQEYSFLVDLTAVDWPEREEGRFDVIYWLHRFSDSKRLRLRTTVGQDDPVETVSTVWRTADWMEREVYDMFGVVFEGHPNLERILTWEGFNGHPLRKDFPVEGIDTGAAIYPEVYPEGGGPEQAEQGGEQ